MDVWPRRLIAFLIAVALSRSAKAEYSAYVDSAVCIVLSLILLRKPIAILRESFADLVDANPFAGAANTVEESARQCVERYRLTGVQWVRSRKAGRRVFVMVSFLDRKSRRRSGSACATPSTLRWRG